MESNKHELIVSDPRIKENECLKKLIQEGMYLVVNRKAIGSGMAGKALALPVFLHSKYKTLYKYNK